MCAEEDGPRMPSSSILFLRRCTGDSDSAGRPCDSQGHRGKGPEGPERDPSPVSPLLLKPQLPPRCLPAPRSQQRCPGVRTAGVDGG